MFPFAILCFVILLPIVPAFILFKALPATGSVEGKLQGLEVKLGGAFAGYFAVVLLILANHAILMPVQYKMWTVTGQVVDENGRPIQPVAYKNISLVPNPLTPIDPGMFSLTFYSSSASSGGTSPTLSISQDSYQTVCYSLDRSKPEASGCSANVTVRGNTIDVGRVTLKKSNPYPDGLSPLNGPSSASATPGPGPGGP